MWIALIFTLSCCRYLSSIPCDKEHIRRSCIWPHWNFTTVRISHSRHLWLRRFYHAQAVTGRKYHYPLCLSSPSLNMPFNVWDLKIYKICSLMWLVRSEQQKESIWCADIQFSKSKTCSLKKENRRKNFYSFTCFLT